MTAAREDSLSGDAVKVATARNSKTDITKSPLQKLYNFQHIALDAIIVLIMVDANKTTESVPDVAMADVLGQPTDNAAGLEQVKGLLKAKDDTSRFVGLALLKSVLDTQAQLREDIALVSSLWESISPKFLAKLLRATKNEKTSNDEAKNMVDIAVAVLHMFGILLPEESREDRRFVDRIAGLVNCLIQRYDKVWPGYTPLSLIITALRRRPS